AVVGLLLADPGYVIDPGFALSAAATGGLIAWSTPLTARLASLAGGRLPGWLCESLAVSFAAELATLPIALAWFGRFALLAPLVNLLVVPLVVPAMAAGGLALVGGGAAVVGAPEPVAILLGLPAWAALALMVGIVRAVSLVPFASVTLGLPLNIGAAAVAASVVVAVASRGRLRAELSRVRGVTSSTRASRIDQDTRPARAARARDGGPLGSPAARLSTGGLAVVVAAIVLVASSR